MLPFTKMQSIGNDFVLVEAADVEACDLACLAIHLCERNYGVGADGLLVIEPDYRLRMFNPDGTEDFCGNGLRCAALYAHLRMGAPEQFVIEHKGREVPMEIGADGEVRAMLPPATYLPELVPHTWTVPLIETEVAGLKGSALSTGSAHFVALVDELPSEAQFQAVSPAVENADMFPERISVMWTKAEGDTLSLRIWERGVGETLGCGTGATAAAVEWVRHRGRPGTITVKSRGGDLRITVTGLDDPVQVAGVPQLVFTGHAPECP